MPALDSESATDSPFTDVYEGPNTSYFVTSLEQNVQYSLRVSGRRLSSTNVAWSPWSLPVTWSTSLPKRRTLAELWIETHGFCSVSTRGGQKVRLQFCSQTIYQWDVHSSLTPMSLLRIWQRCNLWHYRALNGSDLKRQQKRPESFIIVNSSPHNDQILAFATDNSHWGFVHYLLQSGLGVQKYTHEQPAR